MAQLSGKLTGEAYRSLHLHQSIFVHNHVERNFDCPVAERIGNSLVSLPLFHSITEEEIKLVVEQLTSYFKSINY